jgi:hypothetical protein
MRKAGADVGIEALPKAARSLNEEARFLYSIPIPRSQKTRLAVKSALQWGMPALTRRRSVERRQQKITLGEMRASGVRGLLVYRADYKCAHSVAISGDQWPDQIRLSDLEPLFVCQACGQSGAVVRPDFDWDKASKAPPASRG